ncbi:MAG: PIG-L family deacetylase [Bacteroidetes bacterium]|nr:PIG-L family deacetylase [Bacteroidota bacterium]
MNCGSFFRSIFLLLSFHQVTHVLAQSPATYSSGEILHGIQKLKVAASVLYIAAHPDDENTRLLTYLSKEKKYRTAYLSLTRGDGGQNLIGKEQGLALGLIRTQELLAARRIDGAEQFFTSAHDFGYSKTKEETLKQWDRQKILAEVVWVIRQFRPQVIITRFPPDQRAGHGHHAASALLAAEAFDVAADSTQFPEQFQYGVKPWKTTRLLWNTYQFGSGNTTGSDQFHINVGGYNPLLGKTYGTIAALSRSCHKSQGFGVSAQEGEMKEYFVNVKGDSTEKDFILQLDHYRPAYTIPFLRQVEKIEKSFQLTHPAASVSKISKLYQFLKSQSNTEWKNQKLNELLTLLEACLGLQADAFTQQEFAVKNDSLQVQCTVLHHSGLPIRLRSIRLSGMQDDTHNLNRLLIPNVILKDTFSCYVNAHSPEIDPACSIVFELEIDGMKYTLTKPVVYKFTDPVKGEIRWPLTVVPPIAFSIQPSLLILKDTGAPTVQLEIKRYANQFDRKLNIWLQNRKESCLLDSIFLTAQQRQVKLSLQLSQQFLRDSPFIRLTESGNTYHQSVRQIEYDHIPRMVYRSDVKLNPVKVSVNVAAKKIGYINGAGDEVPEAMRQLGLMVEELTEADMTLSRIKQFDAIVMGIRAYNVHAWLTDAHKVFESYVKQGGVVLLQYNTASSVGPLKNKQWPFAFTISRQRVCEENTPVTLLQPSHPLLCFPNKITQVDFEGWVQERSIYEAQPKGEGFIPLLSMNDSGEASQQGSLLVNDLGKGRFIYTGLTFFRQLAAGVPGAYRLWANLVANPDFSTLPLQP